MNSTTRATTMRREFPFWVAACCLIATGLARGGMDGDDPPEIERLRALEARVVRTIETASKAFVFIEGGSGFLVSSDGYVLTNEHVVGGKDETVVQLSNGRRYAAKVVGHDPAGDVALLRLEGAADLPFLEMGDSDALKIGEHVVAVGDPFLVASMTMFFGRTPPSQEPSASLGVVSALHRYSDIYADAIQVDVPVNRGNSGGPLLTLDGKVVGINGKIETRFAIGVNSGVGYAVPMNQIRRFLPVLKEAKGGRVSHGAIPGLHVGERTDAGRGLPVRKVEPGSAAERAGLRAGDRITSVDGLPVATRTRLRGILHTYPAGSEVTIRVGRADEDRELKVALETPGRPYLGVETETAREGGALVTRVFPGSPAEEAGIAAGDIILLFNGRRVTKIEELEAVLKDTNAGDEAVLAVVREGKVREVRLFLEDRRLAPKEEEA